MIRSLIRSLLDRIGLAYAGCLARHEFENQQFVGINERPVEFRFVFQHLAALCPKTVLDVGTGVTALPHLMRNCGFLVTATDNIRDYWPAGMINRHYHVIQDDITDTHLSGPFDFVTCVSVLEHVKDHRAAVRSMFSLVRPGGHIIITCPYNEERYVRNVYELPDTTVTAKYPFITQAFSRAEVEGWVRDNRGEPVEQEYWQFFTGEYWTCGERLCPPVRTTRDGKHQITCLLLRKPAEGTSHT